MKPELQQDQIAAAFCDHFAKFTTIVADANRYGQSPGLEHKYASERSWMLHNYKHVKRQLAKNIQSEPASTLNWSSPLDNFEKLFNPPTLLQLLQKDDRTLSTLLATTKQAVETTYHLNPHRESKLTIS
ncbi:MAG: hypothetical protein ACKVQS_07360 [Fimbriimonadaceae bacterium]